MTIQLRNVSMFNPFVKLFPGLLIAEEKTYTYMEEQSGSIQLK